MKRLLLAIVIIAGILFLVSERTPEWSVEVVYDEPSEENRPAYDFLKETGILEEIAANLKEKSKTPLPFNLHAMECQVPNAYYSSKNNEVRICYELLMSTHESYVEEGIDSYEIMENTIYFILYHEIGHALVDAYQLPITGREEDAVDQLAVIIFAENDEGDHKLYATAMFFKIRSESSSDNPWTEHSFDDQRYYNVLCWAYGKDKERFSGALTDGGLPESRAEGCEFEYYQMKRSWSILLEPHIKR